MATWKRKSSLTSGLIARRMPSMVDLIANLEHIAGILNPKNISLFLKFISAKIINDAPAVKPYELDLVLSLANMNTKTEDAD
jgi:hypothetical protein